MPSRIVEVCFPGAVCPLSSAYGCVVSLTGKVRQRALDRPWIGPRAPARRASCGCTHSPVERSADSCLPAMCDPRIIRHDRAASVLHAPCVLARKSNRGRASCAQLTASPPSPLAPAAQHLFPDLAWRQPQDKCTRRRLSRWPLCSAPRLHTGPVASPCPRPGRLYPACSADCDFRCK